VLESAVAQLHIVFPLELPDARFSASHLSSSEVIVPSLSSTFYALDTGVS